MNLSDELREEYIVDIVGSSIPPNATLSYNILSISITVGDDGSIIAIDESKSSISCKDDNDDVDDTLAVEASTAFLTAEKATSDGRDKEIS